MIRPIAILAALAVTGGCSQGPRLREGMLRPSANPGLVIATERAFARMAREKGTWTAFRHYATDDALSPSPQLESIQQGLKDRPDPPQPIIWGPDAAWSSCDGSFAADTGESVSPNGRKGRFLTIWQRQADGEYGWVLDQGFDSAGGPTDPDTIPARVAECARGSRPDARVRRGEAWGSGQSNDGTLAWETQIAPDCTRTAIVRMMGPNGWEEVFRRTASAPKPAEGQPAPSC
jgi:hypothetical protein